MHGKGNRSVCDKAWNEGEHLYVQPNVWFVNLISNDDYINNDIIQTYRYLIALKSLEALGGLGQTYIVY